jgi:isoquinoline 1-oxidoreductase beta subunit
MEVALDDNNNISGWLHRSVLPSLFGTDSPAKEASGLEISMGMIDLPYNTGSICCETQEAPTKIRVGWLRSVANINHTFAVGCTLDEVADSRGVDPAQNLLDLLGEDRQIDFPSLAAEFWNYNEEVADYPWDTGRFRNVIEQVRDQSKWGKSMSVGGGMGIAAHRSFLTYVACVVEVEVTDGKIKIPNVYYTIDCGVPVNPDRIKSQFEGGAAFASSLALKSEITVKNGVVQQSNFDDYLVARITDAPYNTEVQIIDSNEKPTGVGEPPVPPFIPALCNAIYEATGQRIRKLPIEIV